MPTTITGTDGVSQVQAGAVEQEDLFAGFANGITEADQFRLTTNLSSNGVISSNLERVDNDGQGTLGTGLTENSGVFTFPSTGIWFVSCVCQVANNSEPDNIAITTEVTTDSGSTFSGITRSLGSVGGIARERFDFISVSSLLNVTNTTNVKVRFVLGTVEPTSDIAGSATENETYMTFIRLGDT